jgi:hypothetical protein
VRTRLGEAQRRIERLIDDIEDGAPPRTPSRA